MKNIKIALLLGAIALHACKATDPQANPLVGSWKLIALKWDADKDFKSSDLNPALTVIFGSNGVIYSGENNLPFPGGWCNKAERYSVEDEKIIFAFGKANCIPFVDPQIPVEATIVELTQQTLLIKWSGTTMKFDRIN